MKTTKTEKETIMSMKRLILTAVLAAGAFVHQSAQAQAPITVEVLAGPAQFTDRVDVQVRNKFVGRGTDTINLQDASNIITARVTFQPGAVFPWHTHPGPVLITVVEGEFIYTLAEDCLDRWYPAGTALVDAGFSNVHSAHNPSDSQETVVIATFLGIPPGEGPTTFVNGPAPDVCPLPTP
jgi:quercetin dioxygenase-like cupin family protein